ncbi:spore cortex-lytic protein, partial [Clostridium sp. WILCCON 0112]
MNNRSNGNGKSNTGGLKVQCFWGNDYIPINGVKITVRGTTGSENANNIELLTNVAGLTQVIE